MKHFKLSLLFAGLLLMLIAINSCEESPEEQENNNTYSLSDMEGSWQRHSLVTGTSGYAFWIRGSINNSAGSSSVNLILPNGTWDTVYNTVNASISSTGVVTILDDPHAHSYLSPDKNLIAGTTVRNNMYTLVIDQKTVTGTNYGLNDLQGTWQHHYVTGGGQWSGWVHSTAVFDGSGNYTLSNVVKSDGNTNTSTGTFSLSSSGNITVTGNTSFHGFMSADKTLIVTNMTDGGGGGGLGVIQKVVAGTTYSTADMVGTWQIHDILTGSENWTEHGTITVDANGNSTLNIIKDNGGTFNNPGTLVMSITTDGIVTVAGTDLHGFLSADKKLMIATKGDDSGNAYSLLVIQKMP